TETRRHTILTDHTDTILEIYGSSEPVEDKVGYQELVDEIRRALSQLSNKEKEIFELKLKGYSVEAIQNQLGLRRNTLDVRVFRGSKKLRRILEKKGVL
ncbi:MAG: hypothetical protein ONB05_11920, partial [candidate division KSB1 bacterium]|nr:hypothetical protein [candidate division KSB1 bacterium]